MPIPFEQICARLTTKELINLACTSPMKEAGEITLDTIDYRLYEFDVSSVAGTDVQVVTIKVPKQISDKHIAEASFFYHLKSLQQVA